MKVEETELPGVLMITPTVHRDARGFFMESYNRHLFEQYGIAAEFVQDNHSKSSEGVLRGLHYQHNHPQGKLVRATAGIIYDVAVDLRRSSPHFGKWTGRMLTEEGAEMLWVPEGFAHGFIVVSPTADVQYKVTDFYHPEDEHCLLWNDSKVGIDWPIDGVPLLSQKDSQGKRLVEAMVYS